MADNINVNPSGSTSIATDDVSGVHFQKVKLTQGDDGIDNGLVSSNNPLYVALDFLIRGMMKRLGKLTFDTSGQLRSVVAGSVSISGTPTTNISYGDAGKTAINIITTRRPTIYNLVRS